MRIQKVFSLALPLTRRTSIAASASCIGLFIVLSIIAVGFWSCGGGSGNSAPLPSFPQPQLQMSVNGVLNTTLTTQIASNMLTDSSGQHLVQGPTYNGVFPGPTFLVHPGDTLNINLVNNFPPNPPASRTGAFPADQYITNLHTHGLTVSPLGNSDNIYNTVPPGTSFPISVKIPSNHRAGTFWYHPHVHGSVTYSFLGGMAGMLIVKGGPGSIDAVPEVAAARNVVMVFQVIHTLFNGVVGYVDPQAMQMGSTAIVNGTGNGLWGPYLGTAGIGSFGNTPAYYTTNGVINPTLHMRPGEVQHWRLLAATSGETLLVAIPGLPMNVIANDGETIPKMLTLPSGTPYTMGSGQRVDLLIQAPLNAGTFTLQSLPITTTSSSVTPQGIAPEVHTAKNNEDFPEPNATAAVTLATVVVKGAPLPMSLPSGPLPPPSGLPSMSEMLSTTPDAIRHIDFDLCGVLVRMMPPNSSLPPCATYSARYDAAYWGGIPFTSLNMFRDADDVTYQKDGLFNPNAPLFDNMFVNNYEQWTVVNRSFSDHPFHIHQNPFLVTQVNGIPLPVPEWHDTFIVPAATVASNLPPMALPNINLPCTAPGVPAGCVTYGSIQFITHYDPITVGPIVAVA